MVADSTMTLLHDDEGATTQRLLGLEPALMAFFPFLAALRILPTYARFHVRTGSGDPAKVQLLAERFWQDVSGNPLTAAELADAIEQATLLVPSEDDGWDEESQPYAEDAVAALAYAFRARLSRAAQEAAWGARRVYEAADHFAGIATEALGGDAADEGAVLRHPIVQRELERQARDLAELERLGSIAAPESLLRMYHRSTEEADTFFSPR
jgi:hypothetical protein